MSLGELLSFPATAEYRDPEIMPLPAVKLVEPADYFFTYGSLMRGQARAEVLAHERFEGEGYLTGAKLFDTGYGFPALFLTHDDFRVWGEVYRILHPEVWAMLDKIENGLYTRVARRVHVPGKPPMTREPLCQLYLGNPKFFDPKQMRQITTGRWEGANPRSNH